MKRQVILYGAFDRYNYGDNLMPILFAKYLQKFHAENISDIEFVFASIKASDLSNYNCMPTVPMRDLLNAPEGSSVVVVGGEVLGASIGILYTHIQDSLLVTKALRFLKRISPSVLNKIAKLNYDAVWEYPYSPDKKSFKNKVNVIFNTVGGKPSHKEKAMVVDSDYISVRDDRTFNYIAGYSNPKLVPDSVLLASAVIDDEFFEGVVRKEIRDKLSSDYISVQACPYKVKFSANQMVMELERFTKTHGGEVVLLPIGYASGHDDSIFLEKVNKLANGKFLLLDNLNVWEIMYVISRSKAFFGTSLHGVITAMSFLVPHYSINDSIEKLTSFLQTWSVAPYNHPISISNMTEAFSYSSEKNIAELEQSLLKAQGLISNSLKEVSELL